jgi:hypothetical protein
MTDAEFYALPKRDNLSALSQWRSSAFRGQWCIAWIEGKDNSKGSAERTDILKMTRDWMDAGLAVYNWKRVGDATYFLVQKRGA